MKALGRDLLCAARHLLDRAKRAPHQSIAHEPSQGEHQRQNKHGAKQHFIQARPERLLGVAEADQDATSFERMQAANHSNARSVGEPFRAYGVSTNALSREESSAEDPIAKTLIAVEDRAFGREYF